MNDLTMPLRPVRRILSAAPALLSFAWLTLLAGGSGPGGMLPAAEPTFAERLGWKKGAVVIVLHVDDVGMSHASNLGAIESVERGVATSWAVMMPCAWVSEILFHASRPTEEFPVITGSSESRRGDLLALTDARVRQRIQERGIELTTWRELMLRRQRSTDRLVE